MCHLDLDLLHHFVTIVTNQTYIDLCLDVNLSVLLQRQAEIVKKITKSLQNDDAEEEEEEDGEVRKKKKKKHKYALLFILF